VSYDTNIGAACGVISVSVQYVPATKMWEKQVAPTELNSAFRTVSTNSMLLRSNVD